VISPVEDPLPISVILSGDALVLVDEEDTACSGVDDFLDLVLAGHFGAKLGSLIQAVGFIDDERAIVIGA